MPQLEYFRSRARTPLAFRFLRAGWVQG